MLRCAALVLIFIFLLFIYTFTLNRWCFVCNFSCFSYKLNFLNCLHFVKFAPMSSLIPHSFGGKLCKKSFNHDNFCYIFQLNLNVQVVFFLSNFSSFHVKKSFTSYFVSFRQVCSANEWHAPWFLGRPSPLKRNTLINRGHRVHQTKRYHFLKWRFFDPQRSPFVED